MNAFARTIASFAPTKTAGAASACRGTVALQPNQLTQVAGGAPKGGWLVATDPAAPKGGWA